MRAAVYARYSSDLQREASIEDQVRACRARVEAEGWELAVTHADHGLSGSSRLRPGYQRLLEDARAGAFNIVIAEALDRLSRDQEDVAALYKHLAFAGVRLITLAEGEISELHVGLKGTMNALFLKDLAQKTRRGLEGRVRQGRSGGGLCYGYKVTGELDPRGHPQRGGRRIHEEEAAVVRRIFAEFAAGRSPRAIARSLNLEGTSGPGGRPWGDTTIRGHALRGTGILRNELYVGQLVWNRLRYVKDPRTGKRLSRLNPPEGWIRQPVPELRIVDDALWNAVLARLGALRASPAVAKARAHRFWERRRAQHLLTGLVRCGVCGGPMAAIGRHYLGCSAARRQGSCSNKRSVPRPLVETLILDALRHNLMRPELVAEFVRAFNEETNRARHAAELQVEARRRELGEVARKLDGLIEAMAEGFRAPGLQAKLDALESRKAMLTQELAEAEAPAPRLHPSLAELYARQVAALHEALADPATRDEALEITRGLIERVRVKPGEARGSFELELEGEIAAMVELAQGPERNKAAPDGAAVRDAFRRSVKVVAGAGFEPATFRL
jgi:site-specific DNA recombinase